ncbi:DUF6397 family protein [Streptomyces aureocirculatus]|uniref:DUF6397 family protein n=1 Tax=Streptomyces aureocirculatus TaxID=67275 RepID=UPI0021F0DEA3|nr:DUF6397 family protein [Streptomyces aureocirculatus]
MTAAAAAYAEATAPPDPFRRPPTSSGGPPPSVARSRAARELGLQRGEFDLAVMLGRVRTVADPAGGRRRVRLEEIDRVRETPGYPESLRKHIKTVGTAAGAALMEISPARFTRLARAGVLTPVKWYVNRYRAVVWLYLAEELTQFAASETNAALLTGRAPQAVRDRLEGGGDLRARNWRGRYAGFLLRQSEDPWGRAAAGASLLDPVQLAEVVRDPYERAYLNRLGPEPLTQAASASPTARLIERITTADDPDEISWVRVNLLLTLEEARRLRPAPRPGRPPILASPRPRPHPVPEPPPWPAAPTDADIPAQRLRVDAEPQGRAGGTSSDEPRGLWKWIRRRRN